MTNLERQRDAVKWAQEQSKYRPIPRRQPNPNNPALQHFRSYIQFGRFADAAEKVINDFATEYITGDDIAPNSEKCTYTLKLECFAAAKVNGQYAEHEITLVRTFKKLTTAARRLRAFRKNFTDSYGVEFYSGEIVANPYGANYGDFAVYKIDASGEWAIHYSAARNDIERGAMFTVSNIIRA